MMKRQLLWGWLATQFLAGPLLADEINSLQAALKSQEAQLVDVRELSEWQAGHIAGALHLPLSQLERAQTIPPAIAKDKPVYLYCRSGRRSGIAARLLQKQGYDARSLSTGYAALAKKLARRSAQP